MTQPSAGGIHPAAVGGKVPVFRRRKNVPANTTEVKHRIEVTPSGTPAVIDSKPGPLTVVDKAKSYYHTIITVLAAVLVLLNELVPAVHLIPNYGTQAAGYVSVAIVFVAAAVNFLKSNEHWVQAL
jgi:hypothetical protein